MKSLLIITITLFSTNTFCQNSKSEGFIDYQFTHHYDTLNLDKKHTETLRLYYNNDIAVYRSLARLQFDSAKHAEFQQAVSENKTFNMNLGQLPSGSIEQFFTFSKDQKTLSFRKFLNVNYLAVDTTTINWNLYSDTITIFGYKCQKAVGDFKGRTYTVWFSTSLPYSFGPWKLKGLPGIILKAVDSKNQVSFIASGINTYPSTINIQLPDNPKYTTYKELMKAITAYRENPNTTSPDGSINIQAKGNSMLKKTTKANNPVELIE